MVSTCRPSVFNSQLVSGSGTFIFCPPSRTVSSLLSHMSNSPRLGDRSTRHSPLPGHPSTSLNTEYEEQCLEWKSSSKHVSLEDSRTSPSSVSAAHSKRSGSSTAYDQTLRRLDESQTDWEPSNSLHLPHKAASSKSASRHSPQPWDVIATIGSPRPDGPFVEAVNPAPTSAPQLSISKKEPFKAPRRTKIHVPAACANCKKAHLSCDVNRPCNRCVQTGKQDTCVDVVHKKRGRPRLRESQPAMSTANYSTAAQQEHTSPMKAGSGYSLRVHEHRAPLSQDAAVDITRNALLPKDSTVTDRPIAFLDMNMVVLRVSPAFEQVMGIPGPTLCGNSLESLVDHRDLDLVQQVAGLLRNERMESTYLPPIQIYGTTDLDRTPAVERADLALLTRGHYEHFQSFRLPSYSQESFHSTSLKLARVENHYFVVLLLLGAQHESVRSSQVHHRHSRSTPQAGPSLSINLSSDPISGYAQSRRASSTAMRPSSTSTSSSVLSSSFYSPRTTAPTISAITSPMTTPLHITSDPVNALPQSVHPSMSAGLSAAQSPHHHSSSLPTSHSAPSSYQHLGESFREFSPRQLPPPSALLPRRPSEPRLSSVLLPLVFEPQTQAGQEQPFNTRRNRRYRESSSPSAHGSGEEQPISQNPRKRRKLGLKELVE